MSVHTLAILNEILDFYILRKTNIENFLSVWPYDLWVLQELETCNQQVTQVQNQLHEQISLLATAVRPAPPGL